ncbi:sensor histidine kinase [Paenibacillus sp. GCM10023252]|uniref:sensor histidine kinase n=1 Tax=Paenibacillus sp. GCM10023252 TaxID=3252649 RepID=UPI0036139759
MRISIKLKLGMVLALLLILTVTVISGFVLRGIAEHQQEEMERDLARQGQIASQYVKQNYVTGLVRQQPDSFMKLQGPRMAVYIGMLSGGDQVVLYNPSGEQVGNSLPIQETADVADTLNYAKQGKIAYQTSGDSVIYFTPIQGERELIGIASFHYSLQSSQQFLQTIRDLFLTAGFIATLTGFLLGYGYFYRVANLISKLRRASNQIVAGHYMKAVPTKRRDELGELSQDIYSMSQAIEQHIEEMTEEQRKLELAVRKLQKLEQQQKQFIGNISHEFKTPLTSIKAYVDLLDMYRDDPTLTEDAIQSIGKDTERLYDMVDKVLRLSALEKYDFELQAEKVELSELLKDLSDRMRGKASKFNLTMTTELEPAVIWADRESLMHIFINLIDNAIKYNVQGGTIHITSVIDKGHAAVTIKDSGIGIPPELDAKIFEPFFTINKDRSRLSGGTGLGLPLVKQLAEKQKGVIRYESSVADDSGRGTRFTVIFPLFRD